jgi:pimeloyl-ACP methyl ester carboxylesterase
MLIICLALTLAALAVLIPIAITVERRLVYCAKPYPPETWQQLPPRLEVLRYRTGQGAQVAFYLPPSDGGEPQRLWLMCQGQGGQALGFPGQIWEHGDRGAGHLLCDFPGYGFCEGASTPGRILESQLAAVATLRQRLGWDEARLAERLCVFGYSLGSGVAARFAARQPVRRIILAAAYTSLSEMADRTHGWPCGLLLWHRFDTEDRLHEIAARQPRPRLQLIHGTEDRCIPLEMAQRMAAAHPGWAELTVVPGIDHNATSVAGMRLIRE